MKLDIKNFFKGKVGRNFIIAVGLLGIFLIFISSFINTDSDSDSAVNDSEAEIISQMTVESYREQLESELTSIISQIDGAGQVQIMITMESTIEDVYAVENNIDEQSQSSGEDSANSQYKEETVYVTIKNKDGSESVVMVKQIMPKIRGVLVVCDGGGNTVVKEKITQAVSGVLNISSGKVYVTN